MMAPMLIEARANVEALMPKYDSKAEEWWASQGHFLLGDEVGCQVVLTQYHPLTFHVPGGNYTPDFLHILADGRLCVIEIKALILKNKVISNDDGTHTVKQVHNSGAQRGYRDARAKLRAAATIFGWATWYEVRIARPGVFELERIDGRA